MIWLQLLSLVIGSTAVSLGVLLGTFMGGMCLGSLVLPQLIPSRLHPLRVYAILEILIGIVGIVVVNIVPELGNRYATMAAGHSGLMLRVGMAAVCLLPPTILMGATLPAIARWVETTPQGISWMGFFYGGNIAGAVVGCLGAGFFLLPNLDMPKSTYVAAGINGIVAIAAILLAGATDYRPPAPQPELARATRSPGAGRVYIAIALSGLTALGAEVIWVRLLSLMLGATVYTFSIILGVFLFGLGIGSSVGAMVAREASSARKALGVCQFLVALSIAWAAFAISRSLPYWPIDPSWAKNQPWWIFQVDLVRTMWAVLPGAIVWGASFPIALAGVAARGQDGGKLVGRVYAANTVGAIIGAVAFSIIIVPQVGTVWAQRIAMSIAALSSILLFLPSREEEETDAAEVESSGPGVGLAVWLAIILISVAGLTMTVKKMPWQVVAWGRWVATEYGNTFTDPSTADGTIDAKGEDGKTDEGKLRDKLAKMTDPGDRFSFYVGEGTNVSVAITESRSTKWRYFHGAGKVQASSDPQDMRLQRLLGHISVLAHPKPDDVKDVLVVACGAGVTAGSFIPYPKIEQVHIVDIERLVPTEVTPNFSKQNYGIVDNIKKRNAEGFDYDTVNNKKVTVTYDDGRHYVRTMTEKYDIITSDPIDPWVKGCAALNTIEYYTMCKQHLKPGGVMSLWIPLYESNEDTAKSVIATFFKVFPNGIIWSNDNRGEGYDAVLFGVNSEDPLKINVDEIEALLNQDNYKVVKASLEEVGFGSGGFRAGGLSGPVAAEMFATYAGQAKDMLEWTKEAEDADLINTDRNLRLQYVAGKWFNTYMSKEILNKIMSYYRFPTEIFSGSEGNISAMKQVLRETGRRERVVPTLPENLSVPPPQVPPAPTGAAPTGSAPSGAPPTAPAGQ